MAKQYEMLKTILYFHQQALVAVEAGVETAPIFKLAVREQIARAKYTPEGQVSKIAEICNTIDEQFKQLKVADNVQ
jgi:V/A-type H+-transporting ATPase subunit A